MELVCVFVDVIFSYHAWKVRIEDKSVGMIYTEFLYDLLRKTLIFSPLASHTSSNSNLSFCGILNVITASLIELLCTP